MHPIQIKSHADKPLDTSLGLKPQTYTTPWWVFVAYALSSVPVCYVFSLKEIQDRMGQDSGIRSGKPESERQYWFSRRYYTPNSDLEMVEARNAWQRLGVPRGAPQDPS